MSEHKDKKNRHLVPFSYEGEYGVALRVMDCNCDDCYFESLEEGGFDCDDYLESLCRVVYCSVFGRGGQSRDSSWIKLKRRD